MDDQTGKMARWDADALRTRFSLALSDMYRKEVPLYGDLIKIVNDVDDEVVRQRCQTPHSPNFPTPETTQQVLPPRHRLERHGAIRLGTERELRTIKRLFAIFGMHPVGYYDLSIVGFPLHATAFRPVEIDALDKNPFRVFTTLLRHDLLSADTRAFVQKVLAKRNLFTDRLLELIAVWERDGSLTSPEADELLHESLHIFRWHSEATVSYDEYKWLKAEHPMVADITSFPSAHINHLTPRTLDIDLVQQTMVEGGIPAKERVEGPPRRKCEILLRQTSFKALEESVRFHDESGNLVHGSHTARFGEVEQRGAAVTPKGRQLYDTLLATASAEASRTGADSDAFDQILENTFQRYPDNWGELRAQGLVFLRYKATPHGLEELARLKDRSPSGAMTLSQLIDEGFIDYEPITYEDFLPVSAAGIFTSNLDVATSVHIREAKGDRSGFERSLGVAVADEMDLYRRLQTESFEECRKALMLGEKLEA